MRKPITCAVAGDPHNTEIVIVCDDGTIWYRLNDKDWVQEPNVPGHHTEGTGYVESIETALTQSKAASPEGEYKLALLDELYKQGLEKWYGYGVAVDRVTREMMDDS